MSDFPYDKSFKKWLDMNPNLSHYTATRITQIINHFWNYYYTNSNESPVLEEINTSTIRDYLNFLEVNLGLKATTINKYISYLRHYFNFLYSHNLISNYPLLEIKGRYFQRVHTYTIDWMDKISEISKLPNIHPDTVKILICISLGYKPKQLLNLKYKEVISHLHNTELSQYLKNCLDFTKNKNPYIFSTRKGTAYGFESNVQRKIKNDKNLIGLPSLSFAELRRSYIYSYVSKDLTDTELIKKLNINLKSLQNYRRNLIYFVNLVPYKLPKQKVKAI